MRPWPDRARRRDGPGATSLRGRRSHRTGSLACLGFRKRLGSTGAPPTRSTPLPHRRGSALERNALNFIRQVFLSQPVRTMGLCWLLVTLAGCGGHARGAETAPTDPEAAVRAFLNAVRANSLSGLRELWGTERGPAVRFMGAREA